MNNMFWGFLHTNGTIQVREFDGDHSVYTTKNRSNKNIIKLVVSFKADSKDHALDHIKKELLR